MFDSISKSAEGPTEPKVGKAGLTLSRRLQPLAPKVLKADRLRIFAAESDEMDRYQPWLLAAGGNVTRLESPA